MKAGSHRVAVGTCDIRAGTRNGGANTNVRGLVSLWKFFPPTLPGPRHVLSVQCIRSLETSSVLRTKQEDRQWGVGLGVSLAAPRVLWSAPMFRGCIEGSLYCRVVDVTSILGVNVFAHAFITVNDLGWLASLT